MIVAIRAAEQPVKTDLTTEQRGNNFFVEKWKVTKKGKPRWEKQAYEILEDGTRRDRRLGTWTLDIPVKLPVEETEASTTMSKSEETATRWLEQLRWIWNEALGEIQEFDRFNSYSKADKAFLPCCPLVLRARFGDEEIRIPISERSYRWIDVSDWAQEKEHCFVQRELADGTIKRYQAVLSSPLSPSRKKAKRSKFRPSCPLQIFEDWRSTLLTGISDADLNAIFSQKRYLERYPDRQWFKEIPQQCVRGVLKNLIEAWGKWRYPRAGSDRPGKPHMKSAKRGDAVDCLSFEDAKCVGVKLDKKTGLLQSVLIPKLSPIALPLKSARKWGQLPIANVKLVRRDEWYLQMTTTEKILPLAPTKRKQAVIEIIGKNGILYIREKREYKIPVAKYLEIQSKIDALKATISRQKKTAERQRAENPNYKGSRLKNNIERLRGLQRWLKVAARREIVKLARFAVESGGDLFVQDRPHGLILKPAPVPDDPAIPSWGPNDAEFVAERNKEKREHRTGMFVAALTQKSQEIGRMITVEKPKKTPQKKTQKKKVKKEKN